MSELHYSGPHTETEALQALSTPDFTQAPDAAIRDGADTLRQIYETGFARKKLVGSQAMAIANLRNSADRFFAAGPAHNLRYSNENLTNGYRPPEAAHNNGDPINEADVNDSFLYWNPEEAAKIAGYEEIDYLLHDFEEWRTGLAIPTIRGLIKAAKQLYGYPLDLPFENGSVGQINSFGEPSERELLQTPHDDGVVATVIWTSAPGLEAVQEGKDPIPLTPGPDEVFVMPGGILAKMTGGQIQPLIHQARNHGKQSLNRKSIMYFSAFDPQRGPIKPYISNETNAGVDISQEIRNAVLAYGLSDNFFPE